MRGVHALLQLAYDAFNRHDVDALVSLADPDVEFRSSLAAFEGAYHGHDGIRRYMEDIEAAFGPDWRAEAERFEPVDDEHMIVVATVSGHGAGSGVTLNHRLAHVWEVKNGKLFRGVVYLDPREAFAVSGKPER